MLSCAPRRRGQKACRHFPVALPGSAMTKLVTLTSQGRVTLPKELRASLGLEPGAKLTFSQLADGTVIMRVKHQKLSHLAGILTGQNQPSVTVADMKR